MKPTSLYDGRLAFKTMEEPTVQQIGGNFLYLQCGHNGFLSTNEKVVFEKHLIKSGFVATGQDYSMKYSINV